VRENGKKAFAGLILSCKNKNHSHSCFCGNACDNDSVAFNILTLASLIDATQSGLYLCHVVQSMQGKLSKHCHSRHFCRNACDNNSGCTYYTCPGYIN
jgi:hypothetical protein